MYKSFEIKNFKCFEHLKLENLARVNLIAGKNSVGKSALLEALYLHCDGHNPEILLFLKYRRRPAYESPERRTLVSTLRSFFRNFDAEAAIGLMSTWESGAKRKMVLRLTKRPHPLSQASSGEREWAIGLSAHETGQAERTYYGYYGETAAGEPRMLVVPKPPPHSVLAYPRGARQPIDVKGDSDLFGKLVGGDKVKGDQVCRALKLVEPRLERVELLPDEGTYLMHGHISGTSQPVLLAEMGDGILRVASLIIIMGHCENGVLLVDEIENGLHYSILEDVWQAIGKAARQFNVQVFATTHSRECVGAATEAFKESKSDELAFYRLVNIDGKIENTRYSSETLADAIETGWEVR